MKDEATDDRMINHVSYKIHQPQFISSRLSHEPSKDVLVRSLLLRDFCMMRQPCDEALHREMDS
jgi:hypothetical protein